MSASAGVLAAQTTTLLTSQNNVPARPLDWTYWALSFAMLGVSYEMNSRFEESYE